MIDPSDTTAPVADLGSLADDDVFTYRHDLSGTAPDVNLLRYRLELRATGQTEFYLLHEGYQSVTENLLATLDTTLLENGYYELRLTATDANGLSATDSRRIRIHGGAKVGVVQLSFVV